MVTRKVVPHYQRFMNTISRLANIYSCLLIVMKLARIFRYGLVGIFIIISATYQYR